MNRRLLEKDLHYSDADSEVQRLARARTLAMVSNIDTKASRSITRFVADIDLLKGSDSARLLG